MLEHLAFFASLSQSPADSDDVTMCLLERLQKHICIQTSQDMVSQTLERNTHYLHLTQERNVEKGEEKGRDDFSLPLPLFRAENHCSDGLRGRSHVGVTGVGRKRSRRWRGCWWGWCEDEN